MKKKLTDGEKVFMKLTSFFRKQKEKTRPNMMIFYNFLLDDEIKKSLINVI